MGASFTLMKEIKKAYAISVYFANSQIAKR